MAYRIENKDIVIDGWENGIADSPYQGISDMRCSNIISIPGESSVNFKTTLDTPVAITGTGTVSSSSAANDTITYTTTNNQQLYNGAVISFSTTTITGVTTFTNYFVSVISTGVAKLYSDFLKTTVVNITSDGTGTFYVVNFGTPKHQIVDGIYTYVLDDNGSVWLNNGGSGFFAMGNITKRKVGSTTKTSNGNGLGFYRSPIANAKGYLFVFRNSSIDYFNDVTGEWHYAWRLDTDGADDGWDYEIGYLNTGVTVNNTHTTIRGQGNNLYWCDGAFISSLVANSPTVEFDPTTPATYTYTKQALGIDDNDIAQCLTILGNNIYIGGNLNAVYSWDRIKYYYDFRILIPENGIKRLLTINTTIYIFAGNRGRIYQTNGSQASLYKKVPDHLSDTVEPYFTWGDVYSVKNQIYFGIKATNNAGTVINNYGGLWAIDADTKAIRISNKLSYDSYENYVSCLTINNSVTSGIALYSGWGTTTTYTMNDNGNTYTYYLGGIDKPSTSPYSNYETYADSDMIPIATYLQNKTFEQVEFKLTKPMVSGEGVKIQYRTHITDTFVDVFETLYSATVENNSQNMSGFSTVNWENVQWLQLRILSKSTSTTPSYTRIKEIRIR